MKFMWCDIETTGLDPKNAAPFQVAFIFVSNQKINGAPVRDESTRLFYLNPFDIEGIEFSEDAAKIHGYSKETIESFEKSELVAKKIDEFLKSSVDFRVNEQLFFCGYNSKEFDWNHLVSLFNHWNLNFEKYFYPQKLDVFDQVKRAGALKRLPYLENRKLVTVAKFLGINLENAHDAMGDIQATREVAKSLAQLGVPLQ